LRKPKKINRKNRTGKKNRLNRLKYLEKYPVRFGSVSGFGVPEPANPNRTEPVQFRNEKKKPKPQAASSLLPPISH
jgi:hypothetical protein